MSGNDANGDEGAGGDEPTDDEPTDVDRPADDAGDFPVEGPAFLKAAALASVSPERLPALLRAVQADLGPRIDEYRRRYERVAAEPDREAFLVEPDHWEAVADRLGLADRERDAVVRAHENAVVRVGDDRREELETALEIRTAVVIGVDGGD